MYTVKLTKDKLHTAHRPTSLEPICVVIIVCENESNVVVEFGFGFGSSCGGRFVEFRISQLHFGNFRDSGLPLFLVIMLLDWRMG